MLHAVSTKGSFCASLISISLSVVHLFLSGSSQSLNLSGLYVLFGVSGSTVSWLIVASRVLGCGS